MMFIAFILSYATCQYVSTIAGSGSGNSTDGQGVSATFNSPFGIAVDLSGNVFVTDFLSNKIRKINATGFVSTVAGSGNGSYADGQGISASFNYPTGIFADSISNLYVADSFNQRIRMINSTGYVTTIAGSGAIGSADGQSTSASFKLPFGIWVDSSSNIYIADYASQKIRMINSSGYVSTIAGGNGPGSFVNGQGLNATFNGPMGIALDASRNIYVGDAYNHVIRIINTTGYVSTFSGSGQQGKSDGDPLSASFNSPLGLTIDYLGNLFVADYFNNIIRMVSTTGYASTVAGNGANGFRDGDGTNAEFYHPRGVAVDSIGNIYVADNNNNRIRKIEMPYRATTTATTSSPITISLSVISPSVSTLTSTSVVSFYMSLSVISPSVSTLTSTSVTPPFVPFYMSLASNALISVFTGPSAYIMIIIGAICGAWYARVRVKHSQEQRLHYAYMQKRRQQARSQTN